MPAEWGKITAGEIVSPIQGEFISGPRETQLTGLSTDSRAITPGELFWALKGERFDGHDFIEKAIDKGASGVVAGKDYHPKALQESNIAVITVTDTLRALGDLAGWWRQQYPATVAAITGSVGKTTTKEMTAHILGIGAKTLKNRESFNNLVGLPLTLFLLEEGHQRAVLEMGMNQPGEIARLTEIANPDIGLITNVARSHLEGVGDIEGVAKAKVELLEKMSSSAHAILNGDDELLMKNASPIRGDAITYGTGPDNEIRAEKIRNLGREGISFDLRFHGDSATVRLRVPGYQNVANALAASAIAICLREPLAHIVEGLERFEGLKGRLLLVPLSNDVTLVDDTYNSNPTSLKAALDSVRGLVADKGRVIVGLGEMLELGEETTAAHIEAGGMVAEIGAHFFISMGEHAKEMVKGAVQRGFPRERTLIVDTHLEMEKKIRDLVKSGDLILLKGSRRMGLEKVSEGLKGVWSEEDNHG